MKSLLKFSLLTLFVFIYSCNTESVISDDELIELIVNSKEIGRASCRERV